MKLTLFESSFITGINQATMRRHIQNIWLTASKDNGRWAIECWELLDYAAAKWDEGKLYMTRPEFWKERINAVIYERRTRSVTRANPGHRRACVASKKYLEEVKKTH